MSSSVVAPHLWGNRILICTGEPHVDKLLQVNLERYGQAVVCAHSGQEVVDMLSKTRFPFSRVVLDLQMPGQNALDVIRWIRDHELTRDLWVALLVSNDQDRKWLDGGGPHGPYGANACLKKPFNPIKLLG